MHNRATEKGRAYHNATRHSYESVRRNAHVLDWPNQPMAFKIYEALEPLRPALDLRPSGMAALEAIAAADVETTSEAAVSLEALTRLLYLAAGITRRRAYPGGEILFRAAANTGALYEFELYPVCGDLPGLPAGVYHFSPADMGLRRLREGDYRGVLAQATAGEPAVAQAPCTIICAGTYWRNAWKYQARTYRHFGWDNGTLLANLLAEAAALRLPARVVMGFVDAAVNRLLDLDTHREVAFSMVPVGRVGQPPPPAPAEIPALNLETVPLSRREVDYPAMRQMHAASSLDSPEEVAAWRASLPADPVPSPAGRVISLRPLDRDEAPRDGIEEVILRRGSTRVFSREAIPQAQFSTILERATRGVPADFLPAPGTQLNHLYVIVHAVEGLPPGSYYFRREEGRLETLKEGDFRDAAGYLGLEQELPADASAAVFFLADLEAVFGRLGNRGYRAVQLEAGIVGGKLYLGAYAQGLGATGLTFYDDEVTNFFSPHAQGKSAIFLVALGKRAGRPAR